MTSATASLRPRQYLSGEIASSLTSFRQRHSRVPPAIRGAAVSRSPRGRSGSTGCGFSLSPELLSGNASNFTSSAAFSVSALLCVCGRCVYVRRRFNRAQPVAVPQHPLFFGLFLCFLLLSKPNREKKPRFSCFCHLRLHPRGAIYMEAKK